MTLEKFKNNLRGLNDGKDFDLEFLEPFYTEIKTKPFELSFKEQTMEIKLDSKLLNDDVEYKKFSNSLDAKNTNTLKEVLDLKDTKIEIKPKPLLSFFRKHEQNISIKDDKLDVEIKINKPSLFARIFKGEKESMTIIPKNDDSMKYCAELTKKFGAPKAELSSYNYKYQKEDFSKLQNPVENKKQNEVSNNRTDLKDSHKFADQITKEKENNRNSQIHI